MKLIDRYLFRQLLGPTLLATVAFSTVMLLGESLSFLDLIVQGQNPSLFLKLTLLELPTVVSLILPITIFVAALVALNRLQTEQELVVCFAGGMSRWRVISPVLRLAAMAAIVSLALNLWAAPLCTRILREELTKARTDLASSLVQAGRFNQPSKGLTVYASEVQGHDTLKNLFIDEVNPADGTTNTFSAREGQIAERNGQPVIIMKHGSNQTLSKTGFNFVVFDEYTLELGPFLPKNETVHYKASDRYLHELFYPDLTQPWEKQNRLKLYAEGHARLAAPLYNIALVALALAAVLGGGFSRLGYGKRILVAIGVAAVTRIAGFGVQAVADDTVWLNALQYAVPLAAIAWGLGRVFKRPARVPRAPRVGALATAPGVA